MRILRIFIAAISFIVADGDIYIINQQGKELLKIAIANNKCCYVIIEKAIPVYKNENYVGREPPMHGADKCIHFPPSSHDRNLKFNSSTEDISLVIHTVVIITNGVVLY